MNGKILADGRALYRILCRVMVVSALVAATSGAFAYQSSRWKHAKSDHFVVSYDERTADRVGEALAIAEETRSAIVSYLGSQPSNRPISIVLSDSSDDPNGWAEERNPRVHIDCRKARSLLRGDADWLRAALTHELSHIYSLSILKAPIQLRIGGQLESEEKDVSASASLTLGLNRIPVWFIEGIAQIGSTVVGADSRDPIREMVLMDAARSGRLLGLDAMERFEGSGIEYELAYNQGYSLLSFIENEHPDKPFLGFCALIRKSGFRQAFKLRFKESLPSIYSRWKEDLLSRAAVESIRPAGDRLFDRSGPYVLETAIASGGEYVAANWGNDYERFGIFRKDRRGGYSRIADYSGRTIKVDRDTGKAWYSRRVFDYASGVEDYDLFAIGPGGREARATKGARCLAFDAAGGVLVYAAYENGQTKIVSRSPEGDEIILTRLSYGASVESISIAAPGKALVSLGTSDGARAALLQDSELLPLWEGCEVMDISSAGTGRVVFSSSVEGSPQIYWADLEADPDLWYRVTDAPAGCRFPSVEGEGSELVLNYSRYEGGCYRLYRLESPLSDDAALDVRDISAPPSDRAGSGTAGDRGLWTSSNLLLQFWPLSTGLIAAKGESSGESYVYVPYAGAGFTVLSAPEDFSIDVSFSLLMPRYEGVSAPASLSFSADSDFALGQTRNAVALSIESQDWNSTKIFSAATSFQPAADQALELSAARLWNVATLGSSPAFTYYASTIISLYWDLGATRRSRTDVADLGGDWHALRLGGRAYLPDLMDPSFSWEDAGYLYGTDPYYRVFGEAAFHSLLAGGKIGIGATLYGFSVFGGYRGDLATYNALSSIGGASSFSGYPSGYATVNDLVSASVKIGINPFVDRSARTRSIERLSLSLGIDAGIARCFDGEISVDYPVSAEAELRHRFYLSPSRPSSLSFAIAFPLNDFRQSLGSSPFQLYANFSY